MNIRIADNGFIDACRIVTMILAAIMCGAAMGWLSRRVDTIAERIFIAMVGIFIIAQEAQQIGKAMLVWRMPYLSVLVFAGLYVMLKGVRR